VTQGDKRITPLNIKEGSAYALLFLFFLENRKGDEMNFGQAIEALKSGKKVARRGWNGKGMFVYYVDPSEVSVGNLRGAAKEHVGGVQTDTVKINGHIDMKAADGSVVIGWLASQTDILAEDWGVIG
jgi:hypothetical protein